jgi:hypothetical protein
MAMTAQCVRNHGLFRCSRAASGTVVAVLLLCPSALAGCGSPEEPRVQQVAYCQGHASDTPDSGFLHVEFRHGTTIVATGSVSTGGVVAAEVPWGATQIYVDGVLAGEVNEGVDTDAYHSPAPGDVTYVRSGEGCTETASM